MPGVGTDAYQVLQRLTLPEIGGEQGIVALFGRCLGQNQTGENSVQMADDPILVDSLDFEFPQASPVQLLQLQVDAGRWPEGRAFPPPQQVTNGGHVNFIVFLVSHHLLATIFFDGKAVHNRDFLARLVDVTGQILIVMAGGFKPHQNHLSGAVGDSRLDCLAELVKPGAEDVDLETGGDNLPQPVVKQHNMEIFANIYRDAQDLLRADAADQVGEGLSPPAAQVTPSVSFHECLLFVTLWVTWGRIGAGRKACASSIFRYGCQPHPSADGRYSSRSGGFVKVR